MVPGESGSGGPVVITGAGNGIGRACAEVLTNAGYSAILLDSDADAGAAAASAVPDSRFFACDVADPAAVDVVIGEAVGDGVLAGLVNCAGRTSRTAFHDTDAATWRSLHAINLDGVYHLTRASLPALRRGGGSIVNVASVAGLVGEEGLAAYASTKGAIIALTRSLALELRGIRVNAVCPGQVDTRLMARVTGNPALLAAVVARIPLRRLAQPREIATVVAWLLGPGASYVNGAAIPVDGGETAGITAIALNGSEAAS